jgi:hypothetical protein
MEVASFVRTHDVRALLEATAIVRLVDAFDALIVQAEKTAASDAIAEHCAASWRRRRDVLLQEYRALLV